MTVHCPDCFAQLPTARRRADGRCDSCRRTVGHRRHHRPDILPAQDIDALRYRLLSADGPA